jgi:endoglucanase
MKKFIGAFALTVVFAVSLQAQTNPLLMTTMAVVKDMGLGINLGNTFEAVIVCNPDDQDYQGCKNWVNSMETLETSWGSPTITEAMIKGYADAGFKTVRIPVAWSNKMIGDESNGTYTISPALLNRVQEVVGWVLGNGMYAIVNIHYDGGWWENFPTDSAECMTKYKRIWEQVSNQFKNHSGYLIFESLNEEGVWQDVWNRHNNSGNKARAYGLLNAINQEFTTLVRASGGNNANRHLLIAGYATDINLTCDPLFKMPTDPQNRQAVSVHYYDPFGFTHLTQNESWAEMRLTWGTTADYNELNGYMDKLKTTFVDKGIPVIVGEYGMAAPNRSESEIRNYTLAVAEAIYERNMCPVLWDVQLGDNETQYYYNRKANPPSLVDQQLATGFKEITKDYITPTILPQKVALNSAFATKNGIFLKVQRAARLEIYKVNGKQERVLSFKNGTHSVSLVDLPSGIYIAKVSFGNEKQIFRITR